MSVEQFAWNDPRKVFAHIEIDAIFRRRQPIVKLAARIR
jgi:hypothetical protein